MFSFAGIVAWFATSRLGRFIAAAAGLAVVVGLAVAEVFSAGKKSERAKQDKDTLDNLRARETTDEEIRNLGPADVDQRLRRWLRPDDER